MIQFKVAEVFYSLQGEGKYMGVPSLFIRLSGCPMRCQWCDTPYASWEPEGEMYGLDQLIALCDQYPLAQHIVITGGEPLSFPQLPQLVQGYRSLNKVVTLETAGIIYLETEAQLISLSPKLSNSDPVDAPKHLARHQKLRKNTQPVRDFIEAGHDIQFKFVVANKSDLIEVQELLQEYQVQSLEQVYLMPFTQDPQQFAEFSKEVASWCLETGMSLSHRLHVQLWDDLRGT